MATPGQEPRPVVLGLGPVYDRTRDLSWPLVRVTAGGFLLIHGILKLTMNSIAGFAANSMARRGIEPAVPAAYAVFFLETVGAACIMLGLFTRPFAAMLFVEFLVIIFVAHWGGGFAGFSWARPGGGWEYPAFWALIILAIGLRGGGPYSLDRKLGREF
ncbi:MAG: putative oxidoreductase [Alphaproteobacteria bacterium]|nr:putative oxidoreductase [Alphaproteobacteria bacterium]